MAATSASTNLQTTRDLLITRALRITGEIGTGETGSATRVTECAQAFNDLLKELNASHGMPLWKIKTYTGMAMTAGTSSYTVGIGGTISQVAPNRVIHAYMHDALVVAAPRDLPLLIITKNQYDMLGDKTSQGYVNQLYYSPPGAPTGGTSSINMLGTVYLVQSPNAYVASYQTLVLIGITSFEDMDAAGDALDFPNHWNNAITWALAGQLAYESGNPFSERAMIDKKAMFHINEAKGGDTEEGSLFIQPDMMLLNTHG